ncbi:MAG: hypothetical protein EBX41_01295 [Chitinophagia bacterium]|nr:hypothetical protein [Chitinophagia bacterium]
MASTSVQSLTPIHQIITVEIDKPDYMPGYEKSLKHFAKNANIPGFRKGMVPVNMVKKMAGRQMFMEEVYRAVDTQIKNYITESELSIFGQPLPYDDDSFPDMDFNQPGAYTLKFEIGIRPAVDYHYVFQNIPLTIYRVKVTDEMITKQIDDITIEFGEYTPEEEIGSKSYVNLTYTLCDADGNKLSEEGSFNQVEKFAVSKLPQGLQDRLMGKPKGAVCVFRIPDVCTEEEKAAFEAHLKPKADDETKAPVSINDSDNILLEVVAVNNLIPATIDSALFKKTFPSLNIETEEEFRSEIGKWIQSEFDKICRNMFSEDAYMHLMDHCLFDMPDEFLKRLFIEQAREKGRQITDIEKMYAANKARLRWEHISTIIVEENGLKPELADIKAELANRMANYYGFSSIEEVPWLKSEMDKVMKNEDLVNRTGDDILQARMQAFFEQNMKLELQEISHEELEGINAARRTKGIEFEHRHNIPHSHDHAHDHDYHDHEHDHEHDHDHSHADEHHHHHA